MNNYPTVNPNGQSSPRDTANVINGALEGKLNCLFDGTLTANAGSTTFTEATAPGASRIAPDSFVGWMPRTANAAAALSGMYVSAQANGSVTITHANNAQADRTFRFAIIGG